MFSISFRAFVHFPNFDYITDDAVEELLRQECGELKDKRVDILSDNTPADCEFEVGVPGWV